MASRNLSPLYANLGVPVLRAARALSAGEISGDWTLHWASHSVRKRRAGSTLELDGETRRQDFDLRLGLGAGFTLGLTLPYIEHRAGTLDNLIDGWHAVWGMPDGPRAVQTEDALRFRYTETPGFFLDSATSGMGDVEVSLSKVLVTDTSSQLAVFATHKFATGQARDFTGSGNSATAVGARWSRQQCLLDTLSCHLQAGVADLGASGFDARSDRHAIFAGLSLAWMASDTLALIAQLDGHSVVYDSPALAASGAPLWGTLGLRWAPARAWTMDAQFIEDLAVGSAPDITFRFAISRSL